MLSSKYIQSVQHLTEIQMFCGQKDTFSIISFELSQLTIIFSRRVVLVAGIEEPGLCPQASRQL